MEDDDHHIRNLSAAYSSLMPTRSLLQLVHQFLVPVLPLACPTTTDAGRCVYILLTLQSLSNGKYFLSHACLMSSGSAIAVMIVAGCAPSYFDQHLPNRANFRRETNSATVFRTVLEDTNAGFCPPWCRQSFTESQQGIGPSI